MSASTKRAPRGRFSRRPVDRSSSTVTSSPAARYASATWEPTNPAPPLTRTRRVIPRPRSPARTAIPFLAHDALGRRDLAASLCRRLRRHGLEVINVVEKDVLQLRDRRLDVPRDGEVEQAEGAAAAAANRGGHALPGDDGVRSGRRAEDHVRPCE